VISVEGGTGAAFMAVADGASAPVSDANQARLRYNTGSNQLELSQNGGAYVPIGGGSGSGGWTDGGAVVYLTTSADTVAIGSNSMAGAEKLRVVGGGLLADGSTGAVPVSGAGVRMMWSPSKYALRAGEVTGTQWDAVNVGDWSTAFGLDVKAPGAASFAACRGATSTGDVSVALGDATESEAAYSTAAGRMSKSRRPGQIAMATGNFAAPGDMQQNLITMRRRTTDASVTDMTIDGNAPVGVALPTSNRFILEDGFSYTFEVMVQARNESASEHKSWILSCQIKRDAGAATVAFVGGVNKLVIGQTPGGSNTWDVNLVADAVNGALLPQVKGQLGKNIRWGAGLRWVEVGT
jgi:hypothetical protein